MKCSLHVSKHHLHIAVQRVRISLSSKANKSSQPVSVAFLRVWVGIEMCLFDLRYLNYLKQNARYVHVYLTHEIVPIR